jgi:PAS domain S-box-containing protein
VSTKSQFQSVVDHAPVLIWVADTQGLCTYFNQPWLQFTGRSLEQELGNGWAEGVHPDDLAYCMETFLTAFRARQIFSMEYRLRQGTGEYRWVLDNGIPQFQENHEFTGYIGTCVDITALKQAALQARINLAEANRWRERYEAAGRASNQVLYDFDIQANCVTWGENAAAILSDGDTKLHNHSVDVWFSLIHPDDQLRFQAAFTKVQTEHQPFQQLEYRLQRQDGTYIWVQDNNEILFDDAGQPSHVIGFVANITSRKQTEAALRESEEQNRAILSAIPDILTVINAEGQYLSCFYNRFSGQLLTSETPNSDGFHVSEVLPPESATTCLAAVAQTLKTGEMQIYEQQVQFGDVIQYEEAHIVPYQADKVLCMVRDISDRKRAELALQESEERRRLALDLTETSSWEYDVATGNAIWSDSHYRLMGLNPGAVPSNYQTWRDRVHPDDLAYTEAAFAQALETQSLLNVEYRVVYPNGTVRWVLTKGQGIYDTKGAAIRMVGVMIDISDRKQTELALQQLNEELEQRVQQRTQALAHSEQDLRTIFNHVYDAILIHDLDGTILDMNDRALEIRQATRAQLLAANIADLAAPDAPIDQLPAILERVKAGETMRFEWRERRFSDNTPFDVEISLRQVTLANRPVFITGMRDITDRKQAEQALQDLNLELEQRVSDRTLELQQAIQVAEAANQAKSTFLANMSHELRTPLNAILGFAQLMARDLTLAAEKRAQLGTINRSGKHLLSLINDILEMSKIEAGGATFTAHCFDFFALLDSLEEMFQIRTHEKGLQWRVDRTGSLPRYIETDEKKLRQVLINLVSNAVKFTQTGSVQLHIASQPTEPSQTPDPAVFSQSRPVCLLHFEVEDTGTGIAVDEVESLFEPFIQSRYQSLAQEGTGLGLPISRQFVRLMGGDLTVTSLLGTGSTFRFTIPVHLAETEQPPRERSLPPVLSLAPDQPPYSILVVEDQETNRELLVQLLRSVGFIVQAATNGQEAIALWQTWKPALIWMDIRMPVMDGYETIRQIRQQEQHASEHPHPPTVIIALTANAFEEERTRVLAIGCDDFVRKPFQESELLEKMRAHLGVQYLYANDESMHRAIATPHSLALVEALRDLSPAFRTQLHEATIQLDHQRLQTLLPPLAITDPALADWFSTRLNNFDFEEILHLLGSTASDFDTAPPLPHSPELR